MIATCVFGYLKVYYFPNIYKECYVNNINKTMIIRYVNMIIVIFNYLFILIIIILLLKNTHIISYIIQSINIIWNFDGRTTILPT